MRIKTSIFIFVYIATISLNISVFSNPKTDSLENLLSKVKNSNKVDILNLLSKEYSNENLLKSKFNAIEALKLATSISYKDGIALAYLNKAKIDLKIQNSDSTFIDLNKALDLYKSTKNLEGIAFTNLEIGHYYVTKQQNATALRIFNESLSIFDEIQDLYGKARTIVAISKVYWDWEMFELADETVYIADSLFKMLKDIDGLAYITAYKLKNYVQHGDSLKAKRLIDESENLFARTNDIESIVSYYRFVGAFYADFENNNDTARYYFNKILDMSIKINDKANIGAILTHIGYTYQCQGDYKKDLEYNLMVLEMRKSVDWRQLLASSYLNCGFDYFKLGDYSKAEEFYINALNFARKYDTKFIEKNACLNLSNLYLAKNDIQNSSKYLQLFASINDSLYADQRKSHLLTIQNYRKLTESERANDIEKIKEKYLLTIIIIISLFAFCISLLLLFLYLKKRKINTKLEMKYQNIIESIHEAFVIGDVDGNLIFANDTFCTLYGFESNEIKNLTLKDYIAPESLEIVLDRHFKMCNGLPVSDNFEFQAIKKNGTKIWLEANVSVIKEKGKIIGTQAFEWDITERKLVEESLRKSEEKYRSLYENAQEGIFQTTVDGKYLSVNPALAKILGYESTEELIKSVENIGDERYENPQQRELFLYTILRDGFIKGFEYKVKRKDGSIIWLYEDSNVVKDEFGEIKYFEGFVFDITDRKKAEEALKESEYWLRESQRVGQIGSYILDIENGLWTCSADLDNIFGINSEFEKTISSWNNLVHPNDKDDMMRYFLSKVLGEGKEFDKEYRIIRVYDNSVRWVWGRGELKFNNNGKAIQMFGTIQDITERKNSEVELWKAKEKAEESDKLKTSFLQNMSHEIRTPLNGIIGFSQLLLDYESMSKSEIEENIKLINDSSDRLLGIVNDVLEISRIDTGIMKVTPSLFSIGELVDYCKNIYSGKLKSKGLIFKVKINEDILNTKLFTDKNKLIQIVTNILNNSVKFTEIGEVELSIELNKKGILIKIRDTGIGIDNTLIDKIYDRFWQYEAFSKMKYGGTGLGLSITKSLAELLEFELIVNSKLDVGTDFSILIPIERVLSDNSDKKEKTDVNQLVKLDLTNYNILIVEDDLINYMLLVKMLLSENPKIDRAINGQDALDKVEQKNYNFILMDLKMPVLDGFETSQILRTKYPELIIIAQTAYSQPEELQKAIESGCNDFVKKPISKKNLIEIIRKYID